jgi:hypothetical protein
LNRLNLALGRPGGAGMASTGELAALPVGQAAQHDHTLT